MLIVILEIDNYLVGIPMYSSFQAKYDELRAKLEESPPEECDENEEEKTNHDVGDYGIENLEMPKEEKNLLNKIWIFCKTMHIVFLLAYILGTFFNVFGFVKYMKKEWRERTTRRRK